MHQLKIHLISLLFAFAFLFNIERLDFGAENVFDVQTFVYVLAILITTIILFVPLFSYYRVTLTVAFAMGLYIIGKLIFLDDRLFFGGFYTYLTMTEATLLMVIAFISQRLSQSLIEFQDGFDVMALSLGGKPLQTVSKASGDIRREITRSRHYHRPLSVIVIEPDQRSFHLAMPRIFEELQKGVLTRFARVKLAQSMHHHLRLMDLILEEDGSDRFIILCPEVDSQGSAVLVERVQTVINQAGIAAQCSTATFPDNALTFEGLVNQAKAKLDTSFAEEVKQEKVAEPDIYPVT